MTQIIAKTPPKISFVFGSEKYLLWEGGNLYTILQISFVYDILFNSNMDYKKHSQYQYNLLLFNNKCVLYKYKYFVNGVLYKVPDFYCLMLINWIDNINFIFKKNV